MKTFDPQQERRRLAQLYAGMADGELEKLAGEAGSLNNAAKEALQLEISRRNLGISLQYVAALTKAWPPGPTTLRRFRDLPVALLAQTILDSAGIECFLADANTIRMNWLWSNLLGGIRLWVKPSDIDAVELLDQDYLEVFDVEGVGEYRQPRCPNCESFDISFRELRKRVAYGSIMGMWFTGFIPPILLPLERPGWHCRSCGHSWEGSSDPSQDAP